MASINKVILIGNLGRDPETRFTADGGTAICNILMATSRRFKDGQGQLQEETEWHRVVFFGRQAEIAQQYLRKGNPVYVEGRLRTRRYTDKEGVERYYTEIICETMQLLGSRTSPRSSAPRPQRPVQATAPAAAPASQPAVAADSFSDDDIPF